MPMSHRSLPTYGKEVFDAAALELAIVQIKYPPLPHFGENTYMAGIREALLEEYPLPTTEQAMNLIVTPQGVSQAGGATLLRFTSIDHAWSVILGSDLATVESREYSTINEFAVRFKQLLSLVDVHFRPRYQLRLGLRYVNEFRHTQGHQYETWRRLLNPQLLGLGAQPWLDGTIEQTIGEIKMRRSDGTVLIRHGFLNGTTVSPVPERAAKTGPFYLLDLDYFDEKTRKFSVDWPAERVLSYNQFLYDVFRWSIGDGELYKRLRG